LLALDEDFCSPALALAVDHSDPNASPEGFEAAGLLPKEGVEALMLDEKDDVVGAAGRLPEEAVGVCWATDVK
jgi:hypothetical protein